MNAPNAQTMESFGEQLRAVQDSLCAQLEALDGTGKFISDPWKSDAGWGDTRILEEGVAVERGAVNFSSVQGEQLPQAATANRPKLHGSAYSATGLSVIVHPLNPHVPTAHLNVRLITAGDAWWFGGGFDLTPYYGYSEDCVHWHRTAESCCSVLGDDYYERFKHQCDEYFYLTHRQEPRGIGGIFFDDLSDGGFEHCQRFVVGVAHGFAQGYLPIMQRRLTHTWGERERNFQLYRRGRYAEFNLAQDRGTRFGLQSGGRIESILASLPPQVRWTYTPPHQDDVDSPEALLHENFLTPRDWLNTEREHNA